MATMVKEKKREKKKSKEKTSKPVVKPELPSVLYAPLNDEVPTENISQVVSTTLDDDDEPSTVNPSHDMTQTESVNICPTPHDMTQANEIPETASPMCVDLLTGSPAIEKVQIASDYDLSAKEFARSSDRSCDNAYSELNSKLERLHIPATAVPLSEEQKLSLEAETAYIRANETKEVKSDEATGFIILDEDVEHQKISQSENKLEELLPSAPMLDFEEPQVEHKVEVRVTEPVPKLISMPLEEAIQLFGGAEMAKVMEMSKKEEAAVEAGPTSGPEHPLVDLLSTFKRSLILVEQEHQRLNTEYVEQAKQREALWKITQKHINECKTCSCGERVWFKATYEDAELQKQKMPLARLRLEGWLREVQDSYCHHLHAANLAHCQIEEFVSEIMDSNADVIREALSLILEAMKLSGSAPNALTKALTGWASTLASALLEQGQRPAPLKQLLFLIHHMFRQNRSVRWAKFVIDMHVGDDLEAARALAFLDLLLTRPGVESAVECTEGKDEEWEEVDKNGSGGAVSDHTLREGDLASLLSVFPLRELVARIMLFPDSDVSSVREWQWGDPSHGRGVLRACCGCRALLHVLQRACRTVAHYKRVRGALLLLAQILARVLCALHEHERSSYSTGMEVVVQAELHAVFVSALSLMDAASAHCLPGSLLAAPAAMDYCTSHILHLHDASSPMRVESLSTEVAPFACDVRVAIVAQLAIDRPTDYDLARIVVEFLFATGVKKSNALSGCKEACRKAARKQMPKVLAVHAHLYAVVLLMVAETNTVEKLEPAAIRCLSVSGWRPEPGDAHAVAEDWARRCPHLLPPLLLALDYTPHTGLSLESQLALGSWLCSQAASARSPSEIEEWCWHVVRKLRVHRAYWGLAPDAPPPEPEPSGLLAKAYALLASSWGHSVPLICSEGVSALCSLASARVEDAVHCLDPIMLVLAHAHDSIALTPKFTELFSIIMNSGPGLMQRALGRGGCAGPELLARLLRDQLAGEQCRGVPRAMLVRAWLAALFRPGLLGALALLDTALAACGHAQLTELVMQLARAVDPSSVAQLALASRQAAAAPWVCCSALRALHAQHELLPGLHARLAGALHAQRLAEAKYHVDNALKSIGARIGSEELVIYRCATSVLAAAPAHPASLQLWRLLMLLYLQRVQADVRNTTPPLGPIFFSGIIKSRTLAQLQKKLQESIKYHNTKAAALNEAKAPPKPPSPSNIVIEEAISTEGGVLLPVSIDHFSDEMKETGDTDSEFSDRKSGGEKSDSKEGSPAEVDNTENLLAYHVGAEKMLSAYLQWLSEGERTIATPHHAEVSRFIPEHALEAAWRHWSDTRGPPAAPPEPQPPRPAPAKTPFETAVADILMIQCRARSRRRRIATSPVGDLDLTNTRSLLTLVDQHLKNIVMLSKSWCGDVSRISSLDDKLWALVAALRVPRPLPAMHRKCVNKCGQGVSFVPQGREWCRSTETEKGIIENRDSVMLAVRQLSRSRPDGARTAVALLTIARRLQSETAASQLMEMSWRAAANVSPACAPAADTLTAFFEILAERWLSNDGFACAAFIRASCGVDTGPLQRALVPALVLPARCSAASLAALHAALLHTRAPPRLLFSALSKFELSRWASTVDSGARVEMLAALCEASKRLAAQTADDDLEMLLELLGVQVYQVCSPNELRVLARSFANMAATGELQLSLATHIVRAAERCAPSVAFDDLGHLLRELGVIWWEARARLKGNKRTRHAAYAPHVASLLHALHRALVAAAQQLSYAPERVAMNAWLSLLESWSAWILPHSTPPLLPCGAVEAGEEAYTPMVLRFYEAVNQVMIDCPGTEEYILSQMFEWAVQTYFGVAGAAQQSLVQLSALLGALDEAPWHAHQWLRASTLPALLQVCQHGDKEICLWCARCVRGASCASWLRDVTESSLPARLALLLQLFAQGRLQLQTQTLDEAMSLPWQRLPEPALEEVLTPFFMQQPTAVPYHELPQFRVILAASELYWSPQAGLSLSHVSRMKRARCVSAWVLASSSPPLAHHVHAHTTALLDILTRLAPYLESSENEIEELLSRAMVIMCIEPAATTALQVWVSWTLSAIPVRLLQGCARAVATLTAFECFASLADAAARACMRSSEHGGWSVVVRAWSGCPWAAAAALCARARLHAAYATARAHAHTHAPHDVRAALLALMATDIDFVENEVIVAVWICAACRLVRTYGVSGEQGECRNVACTLLSRWAEPARRSLLQIVTLHSDNDRPQPKHRLLCLFALCVISPGAEGPARAFEAAYTQLGPAGGAGGPAGEGGAGSWAGAPHARRLPRLAARLYPDHHHYFKEELDLAPRDPADA